MNHKLLGSVCAGVLTVGMTGCSLIGLGGRAEEPMEATPQISIEEEMAWENAPALVSKAYTPEDAEMFLEIQNKNLRNVLSKFYAMRLYQIYPQDFDRVIRGSDRAADQALIENVTLTLAFLKGLEEIADRAGYVPVLPETDRADHLRVYLTGVDSMLGIFNVAQNASRVIDMYLLAPELVPYLNDVVLSNSLVGKPAHMGEVFAAGQQRRQSQNRHAQGMFLRKVTAAAAVQVRE